MDTARPEWRSRAWLGASLALSVIALALSLVGVDTPRDATAAVLVAVAAMAVVVIATVRRTRSQRRAYELDLADWAAERAAQRERLRIAADLHDVVSHGLGLITVRAAAAGRVAEPARAAEQADALADIERVGRETTTELRRMLTVLRDPAAAPLRPADTLADLPGIVESARAAGLTVTTEVGDLGEISPGVQLTVCAVLREALANALRHAGPTRASVDVRRQGAVIVVDVADAGPVDGWRAEPGAGHGVGGLRERAGLLGGRVDAGREGAGFRLVARLPDGGVS